MHPPIRIVAALLALVAGCGDGFGPDRSLVALHTLDVPQSARQSDTVRIAFSYALDCVVPPVVETRSTASRVTIAAWTNEGSGTGAPCPDWPPGRTEVRLMPVQNRGVITVTFRQPGGIDSVRVVSVDPSLPAP